MFIKIGGEYVTPVTLVAMRTTIAGIVLFLAMMSGLLEAAREVKERGTFGYLDRALTTPELNSFMQG